MKWGLRFIYLILLLILPFVALIRLAVWFHLRYALPDWASLIGASLITLLILVIYFSFMYSKITGKIGSWMAFKRRIYLAGFLIFCYSTYSLFYISGQQVKHESIKSEYRRLHPILRLAVSTVVLIDRELLITDASRLPEDYDKMGLKTNSRSLHFIQSDGHSHAVDIRTKGRSEKTNKALQLYFRFMGFYTLRHVGTADHLHISLRSKAD